MAEMKVTAPWSSRIGETVTEGTIIKWLKSVGDEVHQDEVLFEVSTDKVDSEVPSTASGYLADILVGEGETVDVGTRLAVISPEPVGSGSGGQSSAPAESPKEESASPAATSLPPDPSPDAVSAPEDNQPFTPAVPTPVSTARPPAAPSPSSSAQVDSVRTDETVTNGRLLSPVVRRLLAENGIDPSAVSGTGPGGRVTRADVLSYVDSRSGPGGGPPPRVPVTDPIPTLPDSALVRPPAPVSRTEGPIAAPIPSGLEEVVPFTNIRRRTAEHMVRSKATSAHTLTAIEIDFENVDRVRRAEQERFREEEGISLTYLPFVLRAVVEALREFPRLNASVGDDALIIHHGLHIGIAVDLDQEGLIVPVIHDADTKRLNGLARQVADLASRARSKKLTADDVTGGTFTITNPGPFGTLFTVPIINQPQVAILSTDGVKRRPVVITGSDGEESIGVHAVGILALSYDHRAVDGAYASAFLSSLRQAIESRDWSLEL